MFNLINGSNHAWPTRKPWLNQAYNASEVGILTRFTRKPWLNQAYQAFEVENFNQAHHESRVIPD